MLGKIQNDLIDVFVEHGDFSVQAISAVNIAFKDIVNHPALQDTFEHIGLREAGTDYWKVVVKAYESDLKDFDVLKSLYQGSNRKHFNVLLESPKEYGYRSSKEPVVTDQAPLPWEFEDLSWLFIEKVKERNSAVKTLFDTPDRIAQNAHEITYHWLDREEARSLLQKYQEGSWRQLEQGLLSGVSYLCIKDWEPMDTKKDWYVLATTPYSVVGGMSIIERPKESSFSLAYVSVAYGFRGEGVAKSMMHAMVEQLSQKNYWLKRTSPSEFVMANININQGFSRLLTEAGILYAPMHSELEKEIIGLAVQFHDYDWKSVVLKNIEEIRQTSQEQTLKNIFAEIRQEIEVGKSLRMTPKAYPFKNG